MKVAQLCPTLCDPIDRIVHGILQARILELVASPFSRGSHYSAQGSLLLCTGVLQLQKAGASLCGGFFHCRALTLGRMGFSSWVCGLNCLTAYGILVPGSEMKPMSPALADQLLTTGSPGKSQDTLRFLVSESQSTKANVVLVLKCMKCWTLQSEKQELLGPSRAQNGFLSRSW